jgi:hypothetical protein
LNRSDVRGENSRKIAARAPRSPITRSLSISQFPDSRDEDRLEQVFYNWRMPQVLARNHITGARPSR